MQPKIICRMCQQGWHHACYGFCDCRCRGRNAGNMPYIDTVSATTLAQFLQWVSVVHPDELKREIDAYLNAVATRLWWDWCGKESQMTWRNQLDAFLLGAQVGLIISVVVLMALGLI